MLVLLCLTVSGAWAQNPDWLRPGDGWDEATKTLTVNSNPSGYQYRDEIEHVIIADGVTEIGNSAFSGCWKLTSVSIPSSVTLIRENAFSSTGLTSVTIPGNEGNGTEIGNDAFDNCENLTTVTLGNGGGKILDFAFQDCDPLTKVIVYAQSAGTWVVEADIFGNTYNDELKIYVPSNLVDDFKGAAAAGWSVFSGRIEPITYKVSLKDATSWQGKAGTGEYQALPLEGVAAGTAVSLKYSGWKLVKSVKATKKGKPAAEATAEDKGKLIGADGYIYADVAAATAAGIYAVAKICYVSGSNGLALALADEGQMIWSTAISTCAAHTPAITGGTWKLATKDEWSNMITAAGGYTALRDGFSSVGGTNMQSAGYWSSTVSDSDNAWYYDFNDGGWLVYTDNAHCVRACLAFGAGSGPDPIELTSTDGETWTLASMPDYDVELEVEYFNITVPTANTADIYAGSTTPLINAGSTTEEGATMKYLVTATNEQPTSTDGFSADVPTAEATAITGPGTYYVWYYLDLASGDDSDISALAVEVTVKAVHVTMKRGTEDATSWQGKAGEGEYQALPLTGLEAGTAVSVKYNGTKKVKSVKAKKAAPALNLTSPAVGQVIGDDGKNYAAGSVPTVVTAVAKICYVSGDHGLALALADEGQMNWSTAISTCAAHTPAFSNGTWKLATKDEWSNMITAAGGYAALRDGFSSVGGSNLQSAGYWSSTENGSDYAKFYHFDENSWYFDYKTRDYFWVRACLAFGAQETVTLNHSANNAWAQETVTLNHSANNTWTLAEMPAFDVELEVEYFNITVPTTNTAVIYATTTPLINAGSTTEEGATMKYLVTATNEQPTSTDGFSADVPTAQATAITGQGTYYVWYYLDLATGDDSDISALAVEVTVKAYATTMKEGTLDADNWQGKAGTGEYQALPLTGLEASTAVTVKYDGRKKVKSVKAKKKMKPAAEATAEDKGKLICADGHIHTNGAEDAACTADRVAMIVYVGSDNGESAPYNHGLALALSDANSEKVHWNTSNTDAGHTKQTNSFTSESGLQYNATHNTNEYPAFKYAIANNGTAAPTGCSAWFLASGYQWTKMIDACKNVLGNKNNYEDLRDGFSSVGGSNLQSDFYYSSSEAAGNEHYVWFYYFTGRFGWYSGNKGLGPGCRVRSCLAF